MDGEHDMNSMNETPDNYILYNYVELYCTVYEYAILYTLPVSR